MAYFTLFSHDSWPWRAPTNPFPSSALRFQYPPPVRLRKGGTRSSSGRGRTGGFSGRACPTLRRTARVLFPCRVSEAESDWRGGWAPGQRTEGSSPGPLRKERGRHVLDARRLGPRTGVRWPGFGEQTYADSGERRSYAPSLGSVRYRDSPMPGLVPEPTRRRPLAAVLGLLVVEAGVWGIGLGAGVRRAIGGLRRVVGRVSCNVFGGEGQGGLDRQKPSGKHDHGRSVC